MLFREDKIFSEILSSRLGHPFRMFSHSQDIVITGQVQVWYEFGTVWTEFRKIFDLIKN